MTPINTPEDIEDATTPDLEDDAYTGPETLPEDPTVNSDDQR